MNLYILSENHPNNHQVGVLCNQNFEEVLARSFNTSFLYPSLNQTIKLGHYRFSDSKIAFIRRYRQRFYKSWFDLEQLPSLGKGPNILLIVGFTPRHLLSLHTLGSLLKKFDLRIAYLHDGFSSDHIDTSVIPYLDHLFVATAEIAAEINQDQRFNSINTHFLPMGFDTFDLKHQERRWIDIISYGRRNENLHQQLVAHSHASNSGQFYFYSTFSHDVLLNKHEHFMLQTKLLENSRISLCFEASDVPRFRGYSPLLYRWFESWAHGCNIIGKKPFGQGTAELMDWPNSTIDLPDHPSDWIPFLESVLADQETLATNSKRNYRECLLRHDWRYRIQTMLETVGLPTPEILKADIQALQERAALISPDPVLVH